jgi:NADH:ubiquinone oxidoreductase subunit 2 (subunit N)
MIYLITAISICIYGLILINIPVVAKGTETGAKYFLLSVCSVALIFGGIKEIHLNLGHLNFSIINNTVFEQILNCTEYGENFSLKFGILLLIFGFFFKISAAPNHFWAPEVYSGLPYELLFFIVIPIKYIFCFIFFKIIKNVFFIFAINHNLNLILWNEIEICLFFAIILSLFIGALNALFENNLKKFIAYSSINQIGFLLIAFLGFNSNIYCIESFIYFLFVYLINLTIFILYFIYFSQLFFIPVFLYNFLYRFFENKFRNYFLLYFLYSLKNNFIFSLQFTYLADLKKFMYIKKNLLSNKDVFNISLFIIIIFSLAGIPPFIGFYGKFYILVYTLQMKYWLILYVGIFTSILSVFYYLRLIKIIFFENTREYNIKLKNLYNNYFTRIINKEFPRNFNNLIFVSNPNFRKTIVQKDKFNVFAQKLSGFLFFTELIKKKNVTVFYWIALIIYIGFPFFENIFSSFIFKLIQTLFFLPF